MGKKKKSKGGSFLMQGSILASSRHYHKDHRGSIPDPDA